MASKKPEIEILKGKTKSGFEFGVSATVLDDMEMIDLLGELEATQSAIALSKVATKLLGPTQKAELYDHYRSDDGRVPVEAIDEAIGEIWDIFGDDGKK